MAKTVFALIFTLIVSASIPSPVFAAITRGLRGSKPIPVTLGGLSITPTIGEYFFAGSEQREATQSYGLKIGYDIIGTSFANNIGIEGALNYFTTKSKTDASAAPGYLFRLDAIYPFILGEKWMPFLAVGAGQIVVDNISNAAKSPLLDFGAGLKYFLEDYLAVRVDARQLVVYANTNTRNNFEIGIGMSYYFGKDRKKSPVPPPAPKQEVKKPVAKTETPESIVLAPLLALESAAKPLSQMEAVSKPVSPDAEILNESAGENSVAGDGSPAKVKAVSKPVSPDKGVTADEGFDATNQSAPAKYGKAVRQTVGEKIVRRLSVNFDTNSSYVKPIYSEKLKELAEIMKSSADKLARAEGHTDSTGKLGYNIILSKKRAQSVQNSLIKLGVEPGLISTVFYGPSRPVADNATIEGRQKNRRVETLVTLIEPEPKIKDEQALLPRIELETKLNEKKRLQAEKRAKASIKAAIVLKAGRGPFSAGSNARLPVEISNTGKNREEFLLTITADKEFDAILTRANRPGENITRLQLAAGEKFKGAIVFRMPAEMIDGHRSVISIKAVSAKFSDISFQKEAVIINSAPFMRVVAKLAKQTVTPGEKLRYQVTVLNAGSLPARNVTVRLQLPPQVDFQGTSDVSFKQEPDGMLVFTVDKVEKGKLAEINLDVKVREESTIGRELRGHVEVVYGGMKRKDIFAGNASFVQEQ